MFEEVSSFDMSLLGVLQYICSAVFIPEVCECVLGLGFIAMKIS